MLLLASLRLSLLGLRALEKKTTGVVATPQVARPQRLRSSLPSCPLVAWWPQICTPQPSLSASVPGEARSHRNEVAPDAL